MLVYIVVTLVSHSALDHGVRCGTIIERAEITHPNTKHIVQFNFRPGAKEGTAARVGVSYIFRPV